MTTEDSKIPKYCSLCLFSRVNGPYWNEDFEEEDYSVYCNKLKRIVHQDLHWTECACCNSKHDGVDKPDDHCPFK